LFLQCRQRLRADAFNCTHAVLHSNSAFGIGHRATGPDKRPPTGYHGGVSLRTATMVDSYDDSLDTGEKANPRSNASCMLWLTLASALRHSSLTCWQNCP
jgi:hypothetical protein